MGCVDRQIDRQIYRHKERDGDRNRDNEKDMLDHIHHNQYPTSKGRQYDASTRSPSISEERILI